MNEKDILKKIGYNGEYTKEVKKNLKSLLKKYHPDHYKGSDDTFKLINKIKKELESGKKFKVNNNQEVKKTISKEDYLWYQEQIDELTKKRNKLLKDKKDKQQELFELQEEYKEEYDVDITNRNNENDNANTIIVLNENKQIIYMIMFILIMTILLLIFTKIYYPIIILVILIIILIIKLIGLHKDIIKSLTINEKVMNKSKKSFTKISNINSDINKLYKEIWDLDCEIGRLTTKINLYYNRIK